MRASCIGCVKRCAADRRRSARADRRRRRARSAVPPSIARSCVVAVAREPGGLDRDQQRAGLLAVREVARVHAPARATPGGRSRAGRPGSRPTCRRDVRGCPAKWRARFARSAIPPWAMISVAPGLALDRARRPSAIGGRPRPPWIRIGTLPLRASCEDGPEPLVGRRELLGARVQLDPAGAEVEAARRLLDRRLVQVEADERDQPALRALGERERPVVGGAEARMPVGLVEAEHERARDAVARPSAARAGRSRRPSRRCRGRGAGERRRARRPGARAAGAPRRTYRRARALFPAGPCTDPS